MTKKEELSNQIPWSSIKTVTPEEAATKPQMTPERFESGKTFAVFVEQAVQLRDLWENTWKRAEVSEKAVSQIDSLPGKWHLLGLTEDWCLDAVSSLSPIARLCEQVSNVNLRLLERDQNLDLMDAHLTRGGRSIPTVILYNDDWREVAWWGPRPEVLQRWYMEEGKDQPMEEKYKFIRSWYVRDKGESTIREVVKMISDASL